MTTKFQINSSEQAQSLIEETKAYRDAERAESEATTPAITTNTGTNASIAYQDSKVSIKSGNPVSGAAREPLPSGYVRLSNGMVTTPDAAKAAGLGHLIEGEPEYYLENPKKGPPSNEGGAGPAQAASSEEQESREDKQQGKDDKPDKALEGATEEQKTAINKAGEALTKATETLGPTAVQGMQEDVVASGVLPTEEALPEGVTMDMVNSVVDGYTAQANAVLQETGATVEALNSMLTDAELKDARTAVFRGDDAKLKAHGRRAVARLANLPNDPATLQQLTADWSPEQGRIERRGKETFVVTPNWSMPWSEAVARGLITF